MDSRFQLLNSGFFVSGTRILDSLSCIPDSKAQDSEFHKQNFPGFRFKIAPCKVIWVPELEKFRLVESGIQLKDSGIVLTIGTH